MKKGDIIASVIVGILAITGLALSIAWQYWFSIIACILCNIMYGFILFCLCRSAYEEKQKNTLKTESEGVYICCACGKNETAPDSQICIECKSKVERYNDWW